MSVECFLDTNVLVYAASATPDDADKKERALDLIASADFGLSTQVLQEFFVTLTRKARVRLASAAAFALLEEYSAFPTVSTDYALIVTAVEISNRFQVSYWDAAIIGAAEILGAPVLYTEDLSHGQRYGEVRVVNPFR